MKDITINAEFTAVVSIPESLSGDTVSYIIYKASDGSVFASGSMTYLAGIQWKVLFTPVSFETYVLEVNNETLDVKYSESYQAVGTYAGTLPPAGTDFTYDTSTNLGKVRELINDTDAADFVMTDAKLNTYLSMAGNGLYRAAAIALIAISASRSLLAKKKSAGDYSEDLTYIAKECRETAKMYNEMAAIDAADELAVPADAQAEVVYDDFSAREIDINKSLRGEYE